MNFGARPRDYLISIPFLITSHSHLLCSSVTSAWTDWLGMGRLLRERLNHPNGPTLLSENPKKSQLRYANKRSLTLINTDTFYG